MKLLQWLAAAVSMVAICAGSRAEDLLDKVDDALTLSSQGGAIRARLSGLLDLEEYAFTPHAPALLASGEHSLFNPRLTLFLDAQLGPTVYFFAQSRFDRGFDPGDRPAQARLDEYALRFTPWQDGRFNIQAGQFASVVGNYRDRHLSWENPFVTAPLPYENLTRVSDITVPYSAGSFLYKYSYNKYDLVPIIWGPSYASGLSTAGKIGMFDYAAEIKNAGLSSRPESWSATDVGFSHPTLSGRLGFRPNEAWNLGVSISEGPYLQSESAPLLPAGHGLNDYRQLLVGQDFSYAWRHVQLWAEFYETRFNVPRVGDADTFAYYLEGKYKFTARSFGALRWNQQLYNAIPYRKEQVIWGYNSWRADASVGFRFTAHTQAKLQYSLQKADSASDRFTHLVAGQLTVRF